MGCARIGSGRHGGDVRRLQEEESRRACAASRGLDEEDHRHGRRLDVGDHFAGGIEEASGRAHGDEHCLRVAGGGFGEAALQVLGGGMGWMVSWMVSLRTRGDWAREGVAKSARRRTRNRESERFTSHPSHCDGWGTRTFGARTGRRDTGYTSAVSCRALTLRQNGRM